MTTPTNGAGRRARDALRTTRIDPHMAELMRLIASQVEPPPPAASTDPSEQVIAEQARAIERLWFLAEASKVLHATADLGELLGIILDLALQKTRADRGTVFLVDAATAELWSLVSEGSAEREVRVPIGRGLAGFVARSGARLNVPDVRRDPRFDPELDELPGHRTTAALCVPIVDRDGAVVGVLSLLDKQEGPFTLDDEEFIVSIAAHAASALDNARMRRELVRHRFMDRELDLARDIQRGLLPQEVPSIPGLDIAVRHESTFQVGGDYFDFVQLDRDNLMFVVGDVEGKGVASALIMSNVQATLYALARHVHALEAILFTLNESILRNTLGAKFVTLFVGLVHLPTRGLHYINAGHHPPVVVPGDGGEPVLLREGGMAVGMFPKERYERGTRPLAPGDLLLVYTDGITETRNARGEELGDARLIAEARRRRGASAAELVDAVFAACDRFGRGGDHMDDRVVMAIKVS